MNRRWIKGALAACALALIVPLSGCDDEAPVTPSAARVGQTVDGQKVYFSFKDPSYDDRGPGFYTYPLVVERAKTRRNQLIDAATDELSNQAVNLDTRTGFFDIRQFDVIDGGPNVIFEITTARPIPRFREDTSSEAKGWYLQLMDIYIDKDHRPGSGRTRTLPGRNVEFTPDSGWEQVILVTPQVSFDVRRLIEQITWDLDFIRFKREIFIPDQVFVEGFKFRVFVPKSRIGEPQPEWGYQCMMMLFNPQNLEYGHFQQGEVKRFAGNNIFGGADEYNGHPNVIDVLAPTPEDQYKWLSDFVSVSNAQDNRFAFLPMLYGEEAPRAPLAKNRGKKQPVQVARRQPARREEPLVLKSAQNRAPARRIIRTPDPRDGRGYDDPRFARTKPVDERAQMAARLRAGGLPDDPYAAEVPGQRRAAQRAPQRRPAARQQYPGPEEEQLLAAPRPARRARIEEPVLAAPPAPEDDGADGYAEPPPRRAPARRPAAPADIDAVSDPDDLFSNTGAAPARRVQPGVRRRTNRDEDYGDID